MKTALWTALALSIIVSVVACSRANQPTATSASVATQPTSVTASATTSTPPVNLNPAISLPADTVVAILVTDKSAARYRVREQLVGVNFPSDAVGETKNITGTIYGKLDGTILPLSKFRVDLRTLVSNEDRRDNFLRQSVLQTRTFPYAEFVPKQVKNLPSPIPTSGPVKFQLIGDLTVRDVTKSVTWEVEGTINGNEGAGTAKTNFNFAYFNLTPPRVPMVLSIQDDIKLEVDAVIRRQ